MGYCFVWRQCFFLLKVPFLRKTWLLLSSLVVPQISYITSVLHIYCSLVQRSLFTPENLDVSSRKTRRPRRPAFHCSRVLMEHVECL